MVLERVSLEGFRCFTAPFTVTPGRKAIFVTGPNGAGKTSFLEAVYTAVRGRSFRTGSLDRIVSTGKKSFSVRVTFKNAAGEGSVEILRRHETQAKQSAPLRNGAESTQQAILREFPHLHIDRNVVDIVSGEPSRRRALLDWILFHVEQEYAALYRSYRRAYVQWRARAISGRSLDKDWETWSDIVHHQASRVEEMRADLCCRMIPSWESAVERLLPGRRITFSYVSSVRDGPYAREGLSVAWQGKSPLRWGPQYSTLRIRVDESDDPRGRLSRGQQKRLAIALLWPSMDEVSRRKRCDVFCLFDDYPSDLDRQSRRDVLSFVTGFEHQIILATTETLDDVLPEVAGDCFTWNIARDF